MTSRGNGETGKLGMSSNRGRPRVVNDRCGSGGERGCGSVEGKGGTAVEKPMSSSLVGWMGK